MPGQSLDGENGVRSLVEAGIDPFNSQIASRWMTAVVDGPLRDAVAGDSVFRTSIATALLSVYAANPYGIGHYLRTEVGDDALIKVLTPAMFEVLSRQESASFLAKSGALMQSIDQLSGQVSASLEEDGAYYRQWFGHAAEDVAATQLQAAVSSVAIGHVIDREVREYNDEFITKVSWLEAFFAPVSLGGALLQSLAFEVAGTPGVASSLAWLLEPLDSAAREATLERIRVGGDEGRTTLGAEAAERAVVWAEAAIFERGTEGGLLVPNRVDEGGGTRRVTPEDVTTYRATWERLLAGGAPAVGKDADSAEAVVEPAIVEPESHAAEEAAPEPVAPEPDVEGLEADVQPADPDASEVTEADTVFSQFRAWVEGSEEDQAPTQLDQLRDSVERPAADPSDTLLDSFRGWLESSSSEAGEAPDTLLDQFRDWISEAPVDADGEMVDEGEQQDVDVDVDGGWTPGGS